MPKSNNMVTADFQVYVTIFQLILNMFSTRKKMQWWALVVNSFHVIHSTEHLVNHT